MNKLLFKAVSLGVSMVGGVVGGVLAGAIFKRGWKLAAGEDEAPKRPMPTMAGGKSCWLRHLRVRFSRWSRPHLTAAPRSAHAS